MDTCPQCNSSPLSNNLQPEPSLHAYTTKYPCNYETITIIETNEIMIEHTCKAKDIINQKIWQWQPFTYICEGFEGQTIELGGVFPCDVRKKCDFIIKKIHGPIIKGFGSWLMFQLVS